MDNMKCETLTVRNGYDGKKCLVHARCCYTPGFMLATAQYLDVSGVDLFGGLQVSISKDDGRTWSEFVPDEGLAPIVNNDIVTVGCDATPMYHKKTGKVILLGHTASYKAESKHPSTDGKRRTFYSVFDERTGLFDGIRFLDMPTGFENCGNGSGQSFELDNGDILVPVYYRKSSETNYYSTVLKCTFDGKNLKLLEMGNSLTVHIERGCCEPSVIHHNGVFYMTMRNDECALVAKSTDGLHYTDMNLWQWQDGSLLQSYNTQQHFMTFNGELYLVYTRRGADNDRVFRHRAPLFAAKVENMRLVRESEFAVTSERGARLGNFCATPFKDGKAVVMAAEWMQPAGCEKYGSDNSVFISFIG